jgi:diguanylate cyclase (GGDEF)-like protein
MPDVTTTDPPFAASTAEVLQGALIDSRHRWRELVNLVADFAFETDEWGRFSLIAPDPALEWAAADLIGRASDELLAEGADAVFDPFRVSARVRNRPAWLKRGDGGIASITFSAAPIRDASGRVIGARGVGTEMTELDGQVAQAAAALRRSEVMDHILRRIGQEVVGSRMMAAALDATADALGARGASVVFGATGTAPPHVAYATGEAAQKATEIVSRHLQSGVMEPVQTTTADGGALLIAACPTRAGAIAGVAAWRSPDARGWDDDDVRLLGSLVKIVRMILDREAIQMEMTLQARTDPLTGLLNRRAFLEEVDRRAARQSHDNEPGTLMFADLDHFKPVNDRMGHEMGDDVLRRTAALLKKTFRPTDLIARLGGDEFAIWLDGADHMTAAERAEYLRDAVPRELAEITGTDLAAITMSIGIASRDPTDAEPLDNLMRRADMAMYQVKRGGRGHWRVSLRKRP